MLPTSRSIGLGKSPKPKVKCKLVGSGLEDDARGSSSEMHISGKEWVRIAIP